MPALPTLAQARAASIAREPIIPTGTRCIVEVQTVNGIEYKQGEVTSQDVGVYSRIYEVRYGPGEWDWQVATRHEIYIPR